MIHISGKKQPGFTLVELLIVVIILALLAAVVVPQFSAPTTDARISSLDTNLNNIRTAIDLYYQKHGEYPGALTAVAPVSCIGTKGTGDAASAANAATAFLEQLSMYTDADGKACSKKIAEFKLGPYMKKSTLPQNPVSQVATFVVLDTASSTTDLAMVGDGAAGGWKYDVLTGKFIANDTNTDPNGVKYDAH